MESLIWAVLIILAVVWFAGKFKRTRKQARRTDVETGPEIKLSISTSPSRSAWSEPDVGSISKSSDGGWILNPRSTFPLTIYGIDLETAREMRGILDESSTTGLYGTGKSLSSIIARTNLRCKEVDEYVNKFGPKYFSMIESLKKESSEWSSASEKDKEDLVLEFREQAIQALDVRPYCDLEILFESEPKDATIDDELIERFGFENLQLYLRFAGNFQKVHVIPADHYYRKGFEKLVDLGLAIRGVDIELSAILESLKLKEMTELVADLEHPPFRRKAKAVEFLLTVTDIRKRVGKTVAFRELFQLRPSPREYAHIDLKDIGEAWSYAGQIGELIAHTYTMAKSATRYSEKDEDDLSFIKGWEISTADDDTCCPYCQRAAEKKYSTNRPPRTPLHVGCRCTVLPLLDY